jgi:Zn-dependent peptidase ImmA (M78 family)
VKNQHLSARTAADIEIQVAKVLRGLGNPEPPLDLLSVRELLKLDRGYYSTDDDSLLRETFSRMKVAGIQVLKRPTLLKEAIQTLSLKALYLPDQKRILLDKNLPPLKHRWNEAHEVGHGIIPWHAGMMLGDDESTLTPTCHAQMESEANFAAGRLLFLGDRFVAEADSTGPSINEATRLSKKFDNTMTSTLWRYVEQTHQELPMVALVTGHPHVSRRKPGFNPVSPCRYCVQSPSFAVRFGRLTEADLFGITVSYCGAQQGGPLGAKDVILCDDAGEQHVFYFETFFNRYEALTLGVWRRLHPLSA